jgi:hypothetical protein
VEILPDQEDARYFAAHRLDPVPDDTFSAMSMNLARGEVPAHVVNPDAVARWRARRG